MNAITQDFDGKNCSVEGCANAVLARGLCSKHYQRQLRHGNPKGGRTEVGEPMAFLTETVFPYTGGDCLTWPFNRSHGYGLVWINGAKRPVHIVACEHRNGAAPSPLHEAAHNCGRGADGCVNPTHLRWATHAENQADRVPHGTSNRGTQQGAAKLSEADVRAIRAAGGLQREIAARFGISRENVSRIKTRTSWGWLE